MVCRYNSLIQGGLFFTVIISDKSSVSSPDKSFSKDEHRFRYSPAFPESRHPRTISWMRW